MVIFQISDNFFQTLCFGEAMKLLILMIVSITGATNLFDNSNNLEVRAEELRQQFKDSQNN